MRTEWEDAACLGAPPEQFFSAELPKSRIGNNPQPTHSEARAIRNYCQQCPIIDACREAGRNENYGIWGGVTANQRKATRRIQNVPEVRP